MNMDVNLLYLVPLAVSLFWVVRIFLLKDVNKVQLLFITGFVMAMLALYAEGFILFSFPFFYLAVRKYISAGGLLKWDYLVFVPSLVLMPYLGTLPVKIFLIVQLVSVSVWGLVSLKKYFSKLAELYDSSNEAVAADDIQQVLLFIVFSVITYSIRFLIPEDGGPIVPLHVALAGFLAVLQYYIGSFTFRIKDTSSVVAELAEIASETEEAVSAGEPASADDILIQRVIDEQLYLDPTLSLVSLSEILHTNRTYLSNSIHASRNQNFSDFINSLRIGYFMDLVRKEPGINVKEAAMRSGYNNLQSFYRHFSDIEGMTPKTWMAHNKL